MARTQSFVTYLFIAMAIGRCGTDVGVGKLTVTTHPPKVSFQYKKHITSLLKIEGGTAPYKVEILSGDAVHENGTLRISSPQDVVAKVSDSSGSVETAKVIVKDITPALKITLPASAGIEDGPVSFSIENEVGETRVRVTNGHGKTIDGAIAPPSLPGSVAVEVSDSVGRSAAASILFYGALKARFGYDDGGDNLPFRGRIRIVADGGIPPYTFSLLDPPPGTTVDASTGELRAGKQPGSFRCVVEDSQGHRSESFYNYVTKQPGSLDRDFGTDGVAQLTGDSRMLNSHVVTNQKGDIFITSFNPENNDVRVLRSTSTGREQHEIRIPLEDKWQDAEVLDARVDSEARVLLLISGFVKKGVNPVVVVRLSSNGQVDSSFGEAGTAKTVFDYFGTSSCLTVQKDGKILIAGGRYDFKTDARSSQIERLDSNGKRDETFGKAGVVDLPLQLHYDENARVIATQSFDGIERILLAGTVDIPDRKDILDLSDNRLAVAALTLEGKPDASFGTEGIFFHEITHRPYSWSERSRLLLSQHVRSLVVLENGGLLLAGEVAYTPFVVRVDGNGKSPRVNVLHGQFQEANLEFFAIPLGKNHVLLKSDSLKDDVHENRYRFRILTLNDEEKSEPPQITKWSDDFMEYSSLRSYRGIAPTENHRWWQSFDGIDLPAVLPDGGIVFVGSTRMIKFFP